MATMHIDPFRLNDLRDDRIQLTGPPVTVEERNVVFPGAFDPLHDGHVRMAKIASKLLDDEVDFELSVRNVDKAEITVKEVARRANQFYDGQILWMTRAPTFAEKAAIFPGATFVIGADTARRLTNLWYYHSDLAGRDAAIVALKSNGCRFLVFGRLVNDVYMSVDDLELPNEWRALCQGITEETFRMDISSTELRRQDEEGL